MQDNAGSRAGMQGAAAAATGRRAFPESLFARMADARPATGQTLRRVGAALAICVSIAGCAATPPSDQGNLCSVLDQNPNWYDYARASESRWGTPVHVQMAFVRHESSFRSHAKPPRKWFLFIPLGRPSSAKGYAQAQDPVWSEYEAERGGLFRSRSDMEDALDFIGWYNHKTSKQLKIPKTDARRLYLAYHEGRGGYRRGTWKKKPGLLKTVDRVVKTASLYEGQLKRCDGRFRCDAWYQIWPFCR